MNRNIERANRACQFAQWVTVCCALVLAFMALGYLALVGDELREARIQQQIGEHE